MRVLVTGGAGFVGSSVALAFKRGHPRAEVVVVDNLRRRGSELNLARLERAGIRFVHGDVRVRSDLDQVEEAYDVLVDAAAEPSVHAGAGALPANLGGTLNCLDFARGRVGAFVFLSTSRVYSIGPLRALSLVETESRFELAGRQPVPGAGPAGIAESFPTDGPRSFYGAGKLASELVVQEYAEAYGLAAVIDRCGVIAGAGQFGRPEQGVVAHWVAGHVLGWPLVYTGFGGKGKQVRDLLHPDDLYALIAGQLDALERCRGEVFNAGGGLERSLSLLELTDLCREAAGREVPIGADERTAPVDVPFYVSDTAKAERSLGWRPTRTPAEIVAELAEWVAEHGEVLRPALA